MKRMKRRSFVWIILAAMIINVLAPFSGIYTAYATGQKSKTQTILDDPELTVNVKSDVIDEGISWEFQYESKLIHKEDSRRLKLELTADGQQVSFPQTDGWNSDQNWFVQDEFSQYSEGRIQVITDQSVQEMSLRIQADSETNGEDEATITKDVLSEALEGPHKLDIPVVQTDNETEPTTGEGEADPDLEDGADEGKPGTQEPSETPKKETKKVVLDDTENLIQAEGAFAFSGGFSPFAVSPYVDPFAYTGDGGQGGQYPTHGTNNYTAGAASDNVKNYNFADTNDSESGVDIRNILSGDLNFDNGYHAYSVGDDNEEIYLKKIVKPTADPTKFEIQLDMIGGVRKEITPIDVVFVIDNSTSMTLASGTQGRTRWQVLQSAFNTFASGLLDAPYPAGTIQIGMVGFGGSTSSPFAEMAYFDNNTNTRFTSNKNQLLQHPSITGSPTGTYTPTFMGLDAGFNLLYNTSFGARSDAVKYLIYLTDGAPTLIPNDSATNYIPTFNSGSTQSSRRTVRTTITSGYWSTNNTDGTAAGNNATIAHANNRRTWNLALGNPATQYAIGLTNQSSFDNVLRALGPDREPYKAWNSEALEAAVQDISNKILSEAGYIKNASVFDTMYAISEFVTLDPDSIQKFALTYNVSGSTPNLTATNVADIGSNNLDLQYAKDVVLDCVDNEQICITNLTLGGKLDSQGNVLHRNGYRITYQVTLNEEYRDGSFYPTNGPTHLEDPQYEDPFGFAVPSVKVPPQTFDINVEKIWDDDENVWGTRKAVVLQLQQKIDGSADDWADVTGKSITIPADAEGDALKGKFTGIPAYSGTAKILYRVVEDRVEGYGPPAYSPASINVETADPTLTVTNTLLKTSVSFTKVAHDGLTPLEDAGFTLYKADGTTPIGDEVMSGAGGNVVFPENILPVGTYFIKETTVPQGYKPQDPIEITVTDQEGVLTVAGLPDDGTVVNELEDFKLIVTKKDASTEENLDGAEFTLECEDPEYSEVSEGEDGVFTFEGLAPGTYTLTETGVPDGYWGLKEPITIVIKADGTVWIDDVQQEDVITADGNIITLDVENEPEGKVYELPSAGGMGTYLFTISGVAMMAAALLMIISNKRRGEE